MEVTIRFEMDLKSLQRASDGYAITVLGIRDFHVCPTGHGVGKASIGAIKALARRMECECAAAFISEGQREFYRKSGWNVSEDTHGDSQKYLALSETIGIIRPIKETW